MAVKKGDNIKVEYTGTFEDGEVFDSSEKHGKSLEFEVGAGQMIKGFDEAVIGMEKDEKKEIKLQPTDAYGETKPELVQSFPKEQFPAEHEPTVGMMLMLNAPDGMQIPARITEVKDKEVTIDMNHPLAGRTLNFTLKVVDISS
jgi:FKBP-type peptidyl-prolyl cis-trans isomerase 2